MAYNQTPLFFLMALALFAASNQMVNAQISLPILGINVNGSLCCGPAGNCPGLPLPGVQVGLNCTNLLGATVTVGQGITGVNGEFNINADNILTLLGSILSDPKCVVFVELPIPASQAVCPILSTATGLLTSSTTVVSSVVSGLLGKIVNLKPLGFLLNHPSLTEY